MKTLGTTLLSIFLTFLFGFKGTLENSCTFSGTQYESGQQWYRKVITSLMKACVSCICNQDGFANCTALSCADCSSNSEIPCCSQCEDPSTPIHQVSCLYNGRVYQDGQMFTANITQNGNNCVQCVCKNGLVMCRLKNCDDCKSHTEECCSACIKQEKKVAKQVMILYGYEPATNNQCMVGDIAYPSGSTWHPVIGPFGQMDCVLCKCQSRRIECSRLECRNLSCSNPQSVSGQCCPACVGNETKAINQTEVPRENSCKNVLDVFKSQASSANSGYYQYCFKLSNAFRLLTWTIKDGGIGDISEQHISEEQFSILVQTFRFRKIGSTSPKLLERFVKKVRRLGSKCDAKCNSKILRLENALQLQNCRS